MTDHATLDGPLRRVEIRIHADIDDPSAFSFLSAGSPPQWERVEGDDAGLLALDTDPATDIRLRVLVSSTPPRIGWTVTIQRGTVPLSGQNHGASFRSEPIEGSEVEGRYLVTVSCAAFVRTYYFEIGRGEAPRVLAKIGLYDDDRPTLAVRPPSR
ncbi:MAG: hypothetical protein H6712_11330 [Myxococcales bacterium]|nr:hypothetical protein [Myxococcales bacterium]MCB9714444.1 hypothetical protein [Myxococcales bacterium]